MKIRNNGNRTIIERMTAMKKLFIGIALAAATTLAAAPKVLVYMLDGARADVMEATDTPAWKMLKENRWADGYRTAWSVTAVNEPFVLPGSAANHTTISTGKFAKNHKVLDKRGVFFAPFSQSATPTVLERIGRKHPLAICTLQAFSWRPDVGLLPKSGRWSAICVSDAVNNVLLVELLKRPDAPSALIVFDDAPDAGGHSKGFYPHSPQYRERVDAAMARFGNLLETIKARSTFADEDWLIVLCSDHGGIGTRHNLSGGQCNTVPLLYCGKNIPAGVISGRPGNIGIAANVLRHMGLENEVSELDDDGKFTAAPPAEARPTSEGLLYDVSVADGRIVNRAAGGSVTAHGTLTVGADSFSNAPGGYLTLDGLKNFAGKKFTVSITLKCDLGKISGDPAVFTNKNWQNGANPGFAITARRGAFRFNSARTKGPVDYVLTSPRRMDLYDILPETPDERHLIAVSVDSDGQVIVFQKSAQGTQYWFTVDGRSVNPVSGLDWNVGQDATGNYKHRAIVDVSSVRVWDRALTLDELRKLDLE